MLTQLARCARDLKVPLEEARAKVVGRFQRTGSVLQGTARGECLGFEIALSLRTSADIEVVRRVLIMAHATCYTESVLRGEIPLVLRHEVNGALLELTAL